jgi:hypothetical protein
MSLEVAGMLVAVALVEPVYGTAELARYMLLAAAACGAATLLGAYAVYFGSPRGVYAM